MEREAQPTAVDLFCGAGGLTLGLMRAGFRVVAAADKWTPAAKSYRLNFPDHAFLELDLSDPELEKRSLDRLGVVPGKVDLVAGGPPCQGFSIQRIGPDMDPRNHLVLRFGEIVARLRARMFLMENVPGLVGKRGRHLVAAFTESMELAGYHVASAILDAADYDVPQRRRRVVICGWRSDDLPAFSLPGPTVDVHRTVQEAIGDLPKPPDDYAPHPDDPLHRRMRLSPLNERRMRHIPAGGGFEDLPVELRVNCHKAGADRIGHRNVYGRLDPNLPAATITARFDSFTRGQFGHPEQHRNISLREGARLQSFPDYHRFVGTQEEIAALIGNAVPPRMAEAVAVAIRSHLEAHARSGRPSRAHRRQLSLFGHANDIGAGHAG